MFELFAGQTKRSTLYIHTSQTYGLENTYMHEEINKEKKERKTNATYDLALALCAMKKKYINTLMKKKENIYIIPAAAVMNVCIQYIEYSMRRKKERRIKRNKYKQQKYGIPAYGSKNMNKTQQDKCSDVYVSIAYDHLLSNGFSDDIFYRNLR